MQHRSWRRAGLAVAAIGLGLAAVVATAPAGAADKVTFTVGTPQDIDSLNPLTGALVIDYEVWNLEYATLTDKAAKDFSVIPGLAESWKASDDGLTVHLHAAGRPEVERRRAASRPTTSPTRSTAPGTRSGSTTSARPPTWTPRRSTTGPSRSRPRSRIRSSRSWTSTSSPSTSGRSSTRPRRSEYEALDGVASGPFRVAEVKKGEFVRMERNPNWHGKQPAMDEVIFRIFSNAEAQYQALKTGRDRRRRRGPGRDLHHPRPERATSRRSQGNQGDFAELAMNSGCGTLGDGHPALKDAKVRQAINYAIDRDLLVEKVLNGLGTPGSALPVVGRPVVVRPPADRRRAARLRPGEGQGPPRRGGLEGHQRRRRPRQGRRRAEAAAVRPAGQDQPAGHRRSSPAG